MRQTDFIKANIISDCRQHIKQKGMSRPFQLDKSRSLFWKLVLFLVRQKRKCCSCACAEAALITSYCTHYEYVLL